MDYPFWDVDTAYGVLMAVIAIPHVFVSHFAIGGGLYLVVAETSARRSGDEARLSYLERLSRFFILVTLVFGALTGVGIWFIIGLLNPAATSVLIHHFVWGWAIEWTFFLVEICAALVYYYGWRRMSPRSHLAVGWIYFAAAWLSLVVINGIICFMLTPGSWLATGNFWNGFFNPTYWPSLFLRTGICLVLAGVYAMLVASRCRVDLKARLVRYNTYWSLAGVAVVVPSLWWYWNGALPPEIVAAALERMPTPMVSLQVTLWALGGVSAFLVLFGLLLPRRMNVAVALLLMALGFGFFGGFEWTRESIRKPFAIYGYMYGNAVEVSRQEAYEEDGYLPYIRFRSGNDGADLFRHSCRSCHTLAGYQPLRPTFDGTDPEFIAGIVRGAGVLRASMPPFLGTAEEADLLAAHLWGKLDQRPFAEVHGAEGVALGEQVFRVRCGICHEQGGFRDVSESIVGLSESDLADLLEMSGEIDEAMPAFTGDEAERDALLVYLQSLGKGEGE
jgi:mono/diheme cytochrome c family protein